jgi:hypothetical protein
MRIVKQHPEKPEVFRVHLGLAEWTEISAWIHENNIQWHALGDHYIGFETKQDAVMFALKWS